MIRDFEIVYEVSWKARQRFLEDQGHPSGTAREAMDEGIRNRYAAVFSALYDRLRA
jgi:hypothetical protein